MDEAQIQAIIEQAMHHRGWIANSYAQVEYLLGDLIGRCRQFPEYAVHTGQVTHSAARRIKKIRAMLNLGGPLAPFADRLITTLDAFEANDWVRNLLAHGFCTFHHTPTGDAGLTFSKFDRDAAQAAEDDFALIERTFRLVDLEYHRAQLTAQAQDAVQLFSTIHDEFGWKGGAVS
ncbi:MULTISPECIES: hypothetical protein [Sphingobium]|uniref:Uncharacterized protein n=1 Tax=Sphingobium yanoikuyae TaxID=13690 RepID=A0A0J9CUP5_SPHYA|nr:MULTISPECIES: hypothetical protein [Sphingobium]ATP18289.1 hypothetical protein BV87_07710 [Sphingobium yanoikuyae]KMW28637.1 hypothetical protein BV87_19640 [Sphingobium yanoikuyae]MBR2270177.1 hypothetical protein [Sphingobium sp.]